MSTTDQTEQRQAAYRIEEWALRTRTSRAKIYQEIAAGRLVARKLGARTLILDEDGQSWLRSLPTLQPSAA